MKFALKMLLKLDESNYFYKELNFKRVSIIDSEMILVGIKFCNITNEIKNSNYLNHRLTKNQLVNKGFISEGVLPTFKYLFLNCMIFKELYNAKPFFILKMYTLLVAFI